MRWTVSGNVAAPLLNLGPERLQDMDIADISDTDRLQKTPPSAKVDTGLVCTTLPRP